jgi:hypothetical protein
MTMMRLVGVAALVLALLGFSCTAAFSTESLRSRSPTTIWMGANADYIPLKQSAAAKMALKIGLNVAPNDSTKKSDMSEGKKRNGGRKNHAAPIISWGSGMEQFFWAESIIPSKGYHSTANMTMHQIDNKESFPLVHLSGALSAESLAWALSLTADGTSVVSDAEEIEQHELLAGGKVRALRRSLVSQLNPKGELFDGILSNLPAALVGEHGGDSEGMEDHPYEDGSVVYYRRTGCDFYDAHHDSYSPGETPRDRQRAYTILIYLRTPPGPPSVGGTEFTRLTIIDANENVACAASRKDGTRVLIVKPRAGDALIRPNFDRDGNPYEDSVHRALPVATLPTARKKSRGSTAQIGKTEDDGIDKVVVNLWFEGFTKS